MERSRLAVFIYGLSDMHRNVIDIISDCPHDVSLLVVMALWTETVYLFKDEIITRGRSGVAKFSHLVAFGGRLHGHELVLDHAVTRVFVSIVNRVFISIGTGVLVVFIACI